MVKCPHCGSTAQVKHLWTDYHTYTHAVEVWECGCGCRIERRMKEFDRLITCPNGGVKYEKGSD